MTTLTYQDGSLIRVGDNVLLENGQTPGTVELVVVTSEEMAAIGVDEPGVMLLSPDIWPRLSSGVVPASGPT